MQDSYGMILYKETDMNIYDTLFDLTTRDVVTQTDSKGKEYTTSSFPFLRGKNMFLGTPYVDEKTLKMFHDLNIKEGRLK